MFVRETIDLVTTTTRLLTISRRKLPLHSDSLDRGHGQEPESRHSLPVRSLATAADDFCNAILPRSAGSTHPTFSGNRSIWMSNGPARSIANSAAVFILKIGPE